MKTNATTEGESPSRLIDLRITKVVAAKTK
jgi:hypothetical protein